MLLESETEKLKEIAWEENKRAFTLLLSLLFIFYRTGTAVIATGGSGVYV